MIWPILDLEIAPLFKLSDKRVISIHLKIFGFVCCFYFHSMPKESSAICNLAIID